MIFPPVNLLVPVISLLDYWSALFPTSLHGAEHDALKNTPSLNRVTHSLVNCWHTGEGQSEAPYLVVYPLDGGNFHVVGGGAHIFMLLVGEDVDANQVNLPKKRLQLCDVLKNPNTANLCCSTCVFFCFMQSLCSAVSINAFWHVDSKIWIPKDVTISPWAILHPDRWYSDSKYCSGGGVSQYC